MQCEFLLPFNQIVAKRANANLNAIPNFRRCELQDHTVCNRFSVKAFWTLPLAHFTFFLLRNPLLSVWHLILHRQLAPTASVEWVRIEEHRGIRYFVDGSSILAYRLSETICLVLIFGNVTRRPLWWLHNRHVRTDKIKDSFRLSSVIDVSDGTRDCSSTSMVQMVTSLTRCRSMTWTIVCNENKTQWIFSKKYCEESRLQ